MRKNKNLIGVIILAGLLLTNLLPTIVSDKVALSNYECFFLGNYFSFSLMLIYLSFKKRKQYDRN
jgi:hypothetical protein